MTVTIKELAALVQGKVVGNGDLSIEDARPLNEAGPGQITFVDSKRNLEKLRASQATAAIVPLQFEATEKTVIHVADPLAAFVAIVQHFQGKPAYVPTGIDPRAEVHADVTLGKDCSVAATASIGAGSRLGARCRIAPGVAIGQNCILGDDVVLHPGVVLYDNTEIGKRVIIHARAVIGADGFGYRFHQGKHVKVPQLGRVVIEDDVEIGAATCIDRATFGATRIGQGTKIDNLVQIGHNCVIGKHNIIVAQVGIAGSSSTGDYVVLAGQVGVADHVHINDGAMVGAQSGVIGDIPAGERWFGYPATPGRDMKRVLVVMQRLPEMLDDLRQIKAKLNMNSKEKAA